MNIFKIRLLQKKKKAEEEEEGKKKNLESSAVSSKSCKKTTLLSKVNRNIKLPGVWKWQSELLVKNERYYREIKEDKRKLKSNKKIILQSKKRQLIMQKSKGFLIHSE